MSSQPVGPAQEFARLHRARTPRGRPQRIVQRVRYLSTALERALPQLPGLTGGTSESQAAEWLLDNAHLLAEALEQLRVGLPLAFLRELPELESGPHRGEPRAYAIAAQLVEEDGGHFDPDRAKAFLKAYRSEAPLRMAELWALPLLLRLVLLEILAATATALAGGAAFQDRTAARLWSTLPRTVDPEEVGAHVQGLRTVDGISWESFFEETSGTYRALVLDPAGVYPRMDFETRDRYRKAVEQIARWGRLGEEGVASAAVALSAQEADGSRRRHVGYFLTEPGRRTLETSLGVVPPAAARLVRACSDHTLPLYLGAITALTVVLLGILVLPLPPGAEAATVAAALLLGLIPGHSLAVELVNWTVTHLVPPRTLPKLDPEGGIPREAHTAVIVPILVASADDVEEVLAQVELNYHGNPDPELRYCLLAALADAPARKMPGDAELLQRLEAGVRDLNERHAASPGFFLLYRARVWNPKQRCWMARERKRGIIEDFNRLVVGDSSELAVRVGDAALLAGLRYAITLDADTRLPPGAARRLIATLAHPLNRAESDARGRVVAGYTVLQPRVEIMPTASARSAFARVFADDRGLDLYSHAVSDVYQDLFGEGSYAGKGIYDIAAFQRSLAGVVPENALLSHDLFEGVHGRAGLVSDVVVFEDYPEHVLGYLRRLHRWIRGDWQLLPWLLPGVPAPSGAHRNRLSALARWKILDNLRRSLLALSLLLLLLVGWLSLPAPLWWWTAAALGPLAAPVALSVTSAARAGAFARRGTVRLEPPHTLVLGAARWALAVSLIPYRAWIEADAIVRTLVRLFVTRRNLLEWTTAAHARSALRGRNGLAAMIVSMAPGLAIALGALALILALRPAALPLAAPFLLAWLAAPEIARRISRSRELEPPSLEPAEIRRLRLLARRTWGFFETFVGPTDQWLPPDNYQEGSRRVTARRTSPTNVGFAVLSTVTAYDLGYLTITGLSARLASTFDTLDRLERYRGHLLNWYATSTLEPLEPRYVSTVDSGNLAGALIALTQACRSARHDPLPRCAADGMADTLAALADASEALGVPAGGGLEQVRARLADIQAETARASGEARAWATYVTRLADEHLPTLEDELVRVIERHAEESTPTGLANLRDWIRRADQHVSAERDELETLLPWLTWAPPPGLLREGTPATPGAPSQEGVPTLPLRIPLVELPVTCERAERDLGDLAASSSPDGETLAWIETARARLRAAAERARQILAELDEIADRAERLVEEMEFAFLYDAQRHLFHVGYDVTAGRPDPSHYDLLASEARLTSLIAIARGEVPDRHWMYLGRPFQRTAGVPALLAWGGTMFEFLLPSVLTLTPPRSLLDMASRSAVRLQQEFARRFRLPWGVSESAYAELDAHGTYQYRSFGVPALALRRDAGKRLVIAPYASALALEVAPRDALRNLERIAAMGGAGPLGLYEAIDFGPASRTARHLPTVVRCYMAHHQGMLLVAIGNLLTRGRMRERFHTDARIAAVELLLHELIPGHAHAEPRLPLAELRRRPAAGAPGVPRRPVSVGPRPQVQVLSNGEFSSLVTARGGGGIRWRGKAITPWQADAAHEPHGLWTYLRDLDSGALWSATEAPTYAAGDRQNILFGLDAVEFHRWQDGIRSTLAVTVAHDLPVELRRLTVVNETRRPRRLRIACYGEVALAPVAEYRRHPAFAKLFVESSFLAVDSALLFHRRAAAPDEDTLWLACGALPDPTAHSMDFETDRSTFVGRRRNTRDPAALEHDRRDEGGSVGTTLDPVFALSYEITLEPGREVEIDFLTAVGASRAEALAHLEACRTRGRVAWEFERATLRCQRELRELRISAGEAELLGEFLSAAVYAYRVEETPTSVFEGAEVARPLRNVLWSLGISGDLPLVVFRARDAAARPLLEAVVRLQAYWRRAGVPIDLLVLDEQEEGYAEPLRHHLQDVLVETGGLYWAGQPGGLFHVPAGRLDPAARAAVLSAASVGIDSGAGSLADQLVATHRRPPPLPPFVPVQSAPLETGPTAEIPRAEGLLFDNGFGGFAPDGSEYAIHLEPGRATPAPWSNVVAGREFGFLATESGLGYTWSGNSGEYRLTPWSNDPVSDPPGEVLYLRDEETAEVWSPTPGPAPAQAAYEVRHGLGYTTFRHASHGLDQRVLASIAPDEPIKIVRVELRNTWPRPRRLTLTYYAEWVLGAHRRTMAPYLVTGFDEETQSILARQRFAAEFAGRVAFLASSERAHGATGDRVEFLGDRGDFARPAALKRIGLAGTFGAHLDPCGALQVHVDLRPGEARTVHFLLGDGADLAETKARIRRFRDPAAADGALAAERETWEEHVSRVQVRTPDPALDLLVNRWLPYQALSCRVWGRSGFYQSSGAYGFRDQLQDVTSLFLLAPHLARAQILEAARHQFAEGDVLHWWHPHTQAGVRTHFSDDLLWLPYVTAAYVEATGDDSILDEPVPYLQGEPLADGELERYAHYPETETGAPLLEHCLRALERGSTRGDHELPLIGTGDWNDAMDRIGVEGRGESVWLAWFLIAALRGVADLCERRADPAAARKLRARAHDYAIAAEEHAWDGAWYRRAYFDDGTPVGSAGNDECRIDSLTQSWGILSGGSDPGRAREALASAREHLVREAEGLVLLLTPPFDRSLPSPGYIRAYPPGVRENGGQYTHAAIWLAWAFARVGEGDEAGRLLRILNPIRRATSEADARAYRVEPFVVAADIYGVPPHTGRGGWTWYTGSAGWLYRLALEAVLGIRLDHGRIVVDPCIPRSWPEYEVVVKVASATYRIRVRNPDAVARGIRCVELDGKCLPSAVLPAPDSGVHEVTVVLGAGEAATDPGRAGASRERAASRRRHDAAPG